MRKIALLVAFCSCAALVSAQQEETADPKANSALEALSKKIKTFKTIKADFTFTNYDKDKKKQDPQKGGLIVKGGKYKLDLLNQLVICDSVTKWTYIKDANSVQINNVDPSADNAGITPVNIFTFYEKGFKSHFESEMQQSGKTIEVIDLYPKHPEREKYHTIKLYIDKLKNQIVEVKVMNKDGTMLDFLIDSFSTNLDIPASTFQFNAKDYPGVEVEDLRN